MRLREIVYCYVTGKVPTPKNMAEVKRSFIENGFHEKQVSEGKWLYKRGASLALEFDYSSESIEMQVILENFGDELQITVGNWGFPFEPLMMKGRFQRNLEAIATQIREQGKLKIDPQKVSEIKKVSKEKSRLAIFVLLAAAIIGSLSILSVKT